MTDIVERLRRIDGYGPDPVFGALPAKEAAAEIERLRMALKDIVKRYDCGDTGWPMEDMREIARRALDEAR